MTIDESGPAVPVQCKSCGDEHLMRDRDAHEFRLDVTVCPECGAKRRTVVVE